MSWLEGLHLALSIALGIGLFVISDDEPFWVRLGEAVLVAFIWLPTLILFALMMALDGLVWLVRWVRRP